MAGSARRSSTFWLTSPAMRIGSGPVVGLVSIVFFGGAAVLGIAGLVRRPVVVALDRSGVTPGSGPLIPWSAVRGVAVKALPAGGEYAVVTYDEAAVRSPRPGLRGGWHARARGWGGPGHYPLRVGAAGSARDLQRMILSPRDIAPNSGR